MAVAGVAVVRFLMEDKVCVSEDLQSSCGVGVLGTLANAASKSAKGMDASLNKMEKRPDGSADAEMTRSSRRPSATVCRRLRTSC